MPLVRNPTPTTAEPSTSNERKPAEILATGSDEERWIAARSAAETPEGLSLLTHALAVERVPRVREAMEGLLNGMKGVSGTTLLGDGRVLIVLDVQEILG